MPSKQPRSGPYRNTVRSGVNPSTGEVVEIVSQELISPNVLRRDRQQFIMITHDATEKLEITSTQWRIVHLILDAYPLGVERFSGAILQSEMSAIIGVGPGAIQAAVAELKDRRVIARAGYGLWTVNPHIGHKGELADWDRLRWQHPLPIWRRVTPGLRAVD